MHEAFLSYPRNDSLTIDATAHLQHQPQVATLRLKVQGRAQTSGQTHRLRRLLHSRPPLSHRTSPLVPTRSSPSSIPYKRTVRATTRHGPAPRTRTITQIHRNLLQSSTGRSRVHRARTKSPPGTVQSYRRHFKTRHWICSTKARTQNATVSRLVGQNQ